MINKYNDIFVVYKDYIEDNSMYSPQVEKEYNPGAIKFPFISCKYSNTIDTDESSIDKIEYYTQEYLTIDIYTKNKNVSGTLVSSTTINDELIKLTIQFFNSLNIKRTSCKPNLNLDTDIKRTTIQYQFMVGNVRGNIIRR